MGVIHHTSPNDALDENDSNEKIHDTSIVIFLNRMLILSQSHLVTHDISYVLFLCTFGTVISPEGCRASITINIPPKHQSMHAFEDLKR